MPHKRPDKMQHSKDQVTDGMTDWLTALFPSLWQLTRVVYQQRHLHSWLKVAHDARSWLKGQFGIEEEERVEEE